MDHLQQTILCKIHVHRRRHDAIIPGISPIAPVEGRSPFDVIDHAPEEPHPPPSGSGRHGSRIAGAGLLWRKLLLLLVLMLLVAMQAIVTAMMRMRMMITGPRAPAQQREPRSLPTLLPGRARGTSGPSS